MTSKPNPPQPDPSVDSRAYWESLKQGKMSLQRCVACRQWQFPAIESCRHCAGKLAMEPISGRGQIYAFIINHRPAAPGFDDLLPYPIALVSPEEDPELHIPGRLVGAANESIAVGQAVQAEIVDLTGGEWKVPVFRVTG